MAARIVSSIIKVEARGIVGRMRITETVDVLGVAVGRKVALFDEITLLCVATTFSNATTGAVTFTGLAAGRQFLLVAFDHTNTWASPTVRRVATLTGARP